MVHVGIFRPFRSPIPASIPLGRNIPDAPLIIAALFGFAEGLLARFVTVLWVTRETIVIVAQRL